MSDRTTLGETYTAGLAAFAAAQHPCTVCGRETSEHHSPDYPVRLIEDREFPNSRICSMPLCRNVQPLE